MKYIIMMVFVVFSLGFGQADAQGNVNIGDIIPHDLTLQDQKNQAQSFKKLTGDKGLVLVFVRSADWCPYCQAELIALNKDVKKFTELGYNVASISYDMPEQMTKFVTKNSPEITMLSDPRSETIRAFGLLNEEIAKGTRSYGVPHPGAFIIDKNKKVQAKFFNAGYKDRVSVATLISKIKELNPPHPPVFDEMTMEDMGQDEILPEDMMIETPDKIMDPIIISDDFNAADEVIEDTVSQETLSPITPEIELPEVDITPAATMPVM